MEVVESSIPQQVSEEHLQQVTEALANIASKYDETPSPSEVREKPLVQSSKPLHQASEIESTEGMVFRDRQVGDGHSPLIEEDDDEEGEEDNVDDDIVDTGKDIGGNDNDYYYYDDDDRRIIRITTMCGSGIMAYADWSSVIHRINSGCKKEKNNQTNELKTCYSWLIKETMIRKT
ncbi:hypothetical protein L6452_40726 [Arctium lappa]|uniref:Uncharacterized protein n=1 Tax=Arctium lappa TaxID=4217 RepID=A0ACB8XN99_ARCLA|nr:hypothetical protein L6452_40726 [Arctium lappa]